MRKMPCLFVRRFDGPRKFEITEQVTPGCEWVLDGEGVATYKWDGTACMVRSGVLYKRYDAKKHPKTGEYKLPPTGAIPCDEPDETTGHWPHWIPVDPAKPEDKWHAHAWSEFVRDTGTGWPADGTYELVGPAINGNPHKFERLGFRRHGDRVMTIFPIDGESFLVSVRAMLEELDGEGFVFHHSDGRMCKIRRRDFGFDWPKPANG